jgi:hypothetical protein
VNPMAAKLAMMKRGQIGAEDESRILVGRMLRAGSIHKMSG